MKDRAPDLFLEDINDAIDKIAAYVKGFSFEDFGADTRTVDAVLRNLEIIGEASKNLSDSIKTEYPEVPWARMIGLRNIVLNEYFGIDLSIIWRIITDNLPEVKPMIMKMLAEMTTD